MAIIDSTYFIGHLSLPTDNANYTNNLNIFINSTQKDELINALGYELYSEFVAELPTPTSQRFTDLLDGVEYTDRFGKLAKWDGLANSELDSFLAYFTYYNYTVANQVTETGNGTTANKWENSDRVSPIAKQVYAYNKGVDNYNELFFYLYENQDTYSEWDLNYWVKKDKINILNL